MRVFLLALYAASFLIANTLWASELEVFDMPRSSHNVTLKNLTGNTYGFGDKRESYRLINFWALWCTTCREEMPSLARFAQDNAAIEVLTVAIGRNDPKLITEFFNENSLEALPVYLDPRQALGKKHDVSAIPHTILLNPRGEEIARIIGGANFDDTDLRAEILSLAK